MTTIAKQNEDTTHTRQPTIKSVCQKKLQNVNKFRFANLLNIKSTSSWLTLGLKREHFLDLN